MFLQKEVASGGSNLAHLGELGGKHLIPFPINRGKREEQKCSTLLISEIHLKLVKKIVSVKKTKSRRFRNVSVGDFAKIFNRSSTFFIHSSSFFGLQPVSSRNRTFQFILCTVSGPHLFDVLLFSFLFTFCTPFDVL